MPNHFKAYFNRGFAYDKIGEFDLAINVLLINYINILNNNIT